MPQHWRDRLVSPEDVMNRIAPGMPIFIGTGVAEPRTLFRRLKDSKAGNLLDLEVFQLVSLGDAIAMGERHAHKYRLKTFFSGWEAEEAITGGLADFIPSRYYEIPRLFRSGRIPVDAVFVQASPPNEAGFCSLGVCVDAARPAMERASLVVGEISEKMPRTFGDTFVHLSEFDLLVASETPPIYFDRWKPDAVLDAVAANCAAVIEDGSCIGSSVGPLYEALARHLVHKKDLSIHTPIFFDHLMDLVQSGAVTNRNKPVFPGKSLTSYAIGTETLMDWLDNNPLVEFQPVDHVFNPIHIAANPGFAAVFPARKVDLYGRVALHTGRGNVGSGPGELVDFFNGALLSEGGRTIFALPSRNRNGEPNILPSVVDHPNPFAAWESVGMIVTEYGVVNIKGRTVRERAQGLIEVAHPDDRAALVEAARERRIIYSDQMYRADSAYLYPSEIAATHTFWLKGGGEGLPGNRASARGSASPDSKRAEAGTAAGAVSGTGAKDSPHVPAGAGWDKDSADSAIPRALTVRFRAIRPSDEEAMRRLFYRFSDEAVYYRYFTRIQAMPHNRMQEYVNVDFNRVMSIVGEIEGGKIIAEIRYVRTTDEDTHPEFALVVDETYQKAGIATYACGLLKRVAMERGLKGLKAYILPKNRKMLRVIEKVDWEVNIKVDEGAYAVTIDFRE
jgi:acyl-CoA hydrolase/RimJ/RimL family protein N-acetyltransferase